MTLTVTVTIPANEETATATHTVGHTNYEALPVPVGMERLWVTDKTTTAFTLHTDSPNMEAEQTRTCLIILTGEAEATDAPYGTVANMKPLCSISSDESTFDAELLLFLNKACSFIDNSLQRYETTLPLTTVPDIIDAIAEYYAAGLYHQRNMEDEKAHGYLAYAEKELKRYIENVYQTSNHEALSSVSDYGEIDESEGVL